MFDYNAFRAALRALVATIYGTITEPGSDSGMLNLDSETQELLNTAMHAINKVYNKKLRPAYDDALIEGKASGKVRSGLEPVRVRKATDKEAPAIPTADDFLDDVFTVKIPEVTV